METGDARRVIDWQQLDARRRALLQERERLTAILNVVIGQIEECNYWLDWLTGGDAADGADSSER